MTQDHMTVQDYIAAWTDHAAPEQLEIVAGLAQADFDALMDASEYCGLGGDELAGLVITRETLDDFDASRRSFWHECGSTKAVECAGRPARLYENFQLGKGQPRTRAMVVVDLGEHRVAVK